ncbi:MAG: phage/plasmid primase, P4 family [Rhodospirillaceae bacterium]
MIPITDGHGRPIAFAGRLIAPAERAGTPKYLNTPDSTLYHKGEVLFGLSHARGAASNQPVVVVEGYLDVIAAEQAGTAAVACCGTALTTRHWDLLWKLRAEPVLCFDGDAAGRAAALRAIEGVLPRLAAERGFRLALLPAGCDPDDLIRRRRDDEPAFGAVIADALSADAALWRLVAEMAPLGTPHERQRLAGSYTMRLPFASLLRNDHQTGAQATPDLADLPGRRFVVASESNEDVEFSTSTIKDLTERTVMKVRQNYGDFFQFTPQHKVVCMTNRLPRVPSDDDGTWRRLMLILWPYIFPRDKDFKSGNPKHKRRDPQLADKVLAELPGILNWVLDGARVYFELGLVPPDGVLAATKDYRDDNDVLGGFVDAVVESAPGLYITGGDLYDAYSRWCQKSGLKPWTGTTFGRKIKEKLRKVTSGVVRYVDVALKSEWATATASDGWER